MLAQQHRCSPSDGEREERGGENFSLIAFTAALLPTPNLPMKPVR